MTPTIIGMLKGVGVFAVGCVLGAVLGGLLGVGYYQITAERLWRTQRFDMGAPGLGMLFYGFGYALLLAPVGGVAFLIAEWRVEKTIWQVAMCAAVVIVAFGLGCVVDRVW